VTDALVSEDVGREYNGTSTSFEGDSGGGAAVLENGMNTVAATTSE
jgi:hypothetical protein